MIAIPSNDSEDFAEVVTRSISVHIFLLVLLRLLPLCVNYFDIDHFLFFCFDEFVAVLRITHFIQLYRNTNTFAGLPRITAKLVFIRFSSSRRFVSIGNFLLVEIYFKVKLFVYFVSRIID
jgi:hypothetical protein